LYAIVAITIEGGGILDSYNHILLNIGFIACLLAAHKDG